MTTAHSLHVARRPLIAAALIVPLVIAGCSNSGPKDAVSSHPSRTAPGPATATRPATTAPASAGIAASPVPRPAGAFTISFAGDVNFMGRTATRLAVDPTTAFGAAAAGLGRADLTMVNLETAITTGGVRQDKAYAFHAPASALTALRDAGIDVATMANNHGADFGSAGLADTLAAIKSSRFPVIGIGADQTAAFTPYKTILNGTKIAIFAADQVNDETTLRLFSAGPNKPGVANAFDPQLSADVAAAKAAGYLVIVYLHWGTEYTTCPNSTQSALADQLAKAGAAAVVGTHAHVLQGAGWRGDGAYVAYGLGNYLWWMSFNNNQDDNGVLTLTFRAGRVVADQFIASHLDDSGVPVPAAGATKTRIDTEWAAARRCAGLLATPPQ